MKKLLFAGIGLIVVLAAAALIVPSFIDWNAYKSDIGGLVKRATGRDLLIAGDIDINLLPAPALVAHDVRLANLPGATAPDMIRLKSMQVRIALMPLLGGSLQVQTIRLIEPAIEVEVFADGRSNLNFSAPGDNKAGGEPAGHPGGPSGGDEPPESATPAISLDSFAIENGTLIYRDRRQGRVERIDGIDAEIAAASLNGPFNAKGEMALRGVPLKFDVSVGDTASERGVPVNATLESRPSAAKLTLIATLTGLSDAPKLKGKLHAEGKNLAALAYALSGAAELPGPLAQSFKADGDIAGGADRTEISNLLFQLGDMQGTAVASLQPGDTTAVSAAVSMVRVDLDSWLALPPFQPAAAKAEVRQGQVAPQGDRASIELGRAQPRAVPAAGARPFALPENLIGILDVNVGIISYRGNLIRELHASADLGNGSIDINQMSAQLPGSSDANLTGTLKFIEGKPQFMGDVAATINDLRGVLSWLGTPLPGVPGDRLRLTTVKSKVTIDPDELQLSGLDLRIDGSHIAGALTVALRERPAFGANLTVDRLNLDSYLAAAEPEAATGTTGTATASTAAATGGSGPAIAVTPTALGVLKDFDTNLRARIDSLTYQRTPIRDLAVDLTLVRGEMQIRQASVADIAGSSLSLSGGLVGLGASPEAKALRIDVKSPDTGRLFRVLGVTPPLPPEQLGAVSLGGLFDGPLLAPTMDATLAAAGGEFAMKGKISALSADTMVDGRVSVKHPDLPRLLRMLGVDYRPVGPIGAVALTAQVAGGPLKLTMNGIDGTIGGAAVKGDAAFDHSGPRPRLTAKLTTGDVIVDRFLPPQRAAGLPFPSPADERPDIVPAAWPAMPAAKVPSPFVPVAVNERWSREPLNLGVLQALDAEVALNATALAYQGYRLEQADIVASLAGGHLKTERLQGKLFGGAFNGAVTVESEGAPKVTFHLNLQGGNLAQLLAATGSNDKASGTVSTELALVGAGASMAEMIGRLGGNGRFALTGIDTTQTARGSPLAGLFELLTGINRFGAVLAGGRTDGRSDLTGTYKVENGVARSEDIKLVSAVGNGAATAQVDLPEWQVDLQGQLDLKQNLVAAYLTRNTNKVPTTVPFQIRGPLDKPNVRVETAGLGGQTLPIPSSVLDKLIERNSSTGKVLQQVLPELGAEPAPAPEAAPPPQAEEQPAPPKPEKPSDLIRGLLKGLGR